MKLKAFLDGKGGRGFHFWCPGCDMPHGVYIDNPNSLGAKWGFNGNEESPTFTPSILCRTPGKASTEVCHSFVTDGKIQFLGDCTHELAGKTVEIPEWKPNWD